ncbi:MAG: acyltransferase [Litorimonas sp.]
MRIRDGHDNFFTPLRLTFAVLVMVGHAYVIGAGSPDLEPHVFYNYSFSYLAVNLFFVASGFLVTKSMLYRGDGPSFASARLLRIFPALIVHVLFVLMVGAVLTTLPLLSYLSHPDVLWQPLRVLSFYDTSMILPGVFEGNGEPFASAPLWTLRYEILCYIATLLIFSVGLMRRKWMVLAQFILPSTLWIVGQTLGVFETLPGTVENAVRFGIAYGLGATIYAYRDRFAYTWAAVPVLLALCWLLRGSPMLEIAMNVILAWLVITIAYARAPKLAVLQKLDDVSYGVYIYHWVVMQSLFAVMPELGVTELFALAVVPVFALSWLSWTYVEKPMLAKKTAFGNWLRRGRKPNAFDAKTVLAD